ncbi:MAG: PRC-barrel domain-containing protein [Actinomycetota bacterium]|nr:PRC-barrel domain-containing protein [Actinomycetota bacterium]
MSAQDKHTLIKLSESQGAVADLADDLRGRKVKDEEGNDIGTVVDLLLDVRDRKVRFLLVDHGGFLGFVRKRSFLPVDAITEITEHDVRINHSRDHVVQSPPYHPDLTFDRDYHNAVYGHYGYKAYWQPDYLYPVLPHSF